MNTPLRRVAVACLVLFGLLLINVNYIQGVQAESLRNHPGNARILIQQYERERGQIIVGGQPIASSKPTNDNLKYLRTYSNGPLFAPATGYYSLFGSTGIERSENDILAGTDDRLIVRRLVDMITGKEPKGGTVALTLNKAAQQAAYGGLAGKQGAAVALDPETGEILALATSPSYDPNRLASHEPDEVRSAYRELNQNPSKPLLDRGIAETYPPGSTFKVVTAAAALSSGKYQPTSTVRAPDTLALPQSTATIQNFGGATCLNGQTDTLEHALQISCNTAFANIGLQLGARSLETQAERFGFNDEFEVPMTAAESAFPSGIDAPQTALSAIGQYEVRMTPLQGAMIAAAVGNSGIVMEPHLVKEIKGPDLRTIDRTRPEVYGEAISPQVASQLTQMMMLVVSDGSGTAAQIPGVSVAGKTGTAQHAEGASPHAWFMGFAPADDPQVAVAVVVEDGGDLGSEATGGEVAAPIAKSIMEAVLR